VLNDVNGTFASPNYPAGVTAAFSCRWSIRVPARRNINLRLTVIPALSAATGGSGARPGWSPGGGGGGGGGGSGAGPDRSCPSSYVRVLVDWSPSGELGRYCTAVSNNK